MKVYVTMGIPGSGKSYFVHRTIQNQQQDDWDRTSSVINPDSIRKMLTGDEGDQTQNSRVFDLAHGRLRWLLLAASDPPVIFDATNVQKFARRNLLDICAEFDAEPHLIVFDTPKAVCLQRNRERERQVPDHAIKRMHGAFLEAMDQISNEGWASITTAEMEWDEAHGVMTLTPKI